MMLLRFLLKDLHQMYKYTVVFYICFLAIFVARTTSYSMHALLVGALTLVPLAAFVVLVLRVSLWVAWSWSCNSTGKFNNFEDRYAEYKSFGVLRW